MDKHIQPTTIISNHFNQLISNNDLQKHYQTSHNHTKNNQINQTSNHHPQNYENNITQIIQPQTNDIQLSHYKHNKKLQYNPIHNPILQHNQQISYRPDIDGLRAIAIISVLIFHAYPQLLTGGFIGVDIFFVISGYLITKIINKQYINNKFSYKQFYSRRIRRIFPALIIVLIFILVVTTQKLNKRQIQLTTNTIPASTLFGANIQILTYEKDYFDPDTKTNPVLHLWSLGVQQQFYMIWPLIISIVIGKQSINNQKNMSINKKGLYLLIVYTYLCFMCNIGASLINIKFDFYFPFCRFWQMAVGGIITYLNITILNDKINNLLSTIGLIAILISVYMITQNSLFPAWWALVPTLGAAFIIQAGINSKINKYILSFKPMVLIGKISYSLYLWHWPLLVFSRILYPVGSLSLLSKAHVAIAIAVVCSIVSYHLIQKPIRRLRKRRYILILLLIMFIIGVSSIIIKINSQYFQSKLNQSQYQQFQHDMIPKQTDYYINKNGRNITNYSKNKFRQPPTVIKIQLSSFQLGYKRDNQILLQKKIDQSSKFYRGYGARNMTHYEVANQKQGSNNLLLIAGDSHARFTAFRFGQLYRIALKQNKTHNFPTIVAITFSGSTLMPYQQSHKFVTQWINDFKPNRVFFVFRWADRWFNRRGGQGWHEDIYDHKDQYYYENVQHFIDTVQDIQSHNIDVTIATYNPQGPQFNPFRMTDQQGIIQANIKPIRLSQYKGKYTQYIEYLQQGVKKVGGQILDFSDNQCYNDVCQVLTPLGYSLYSDNDHLTQVTSKNWLTVIDYLTVF